MQPTVQSEQDKMVPIDTSGDPVEIEVKEDDKTDTQKDLNLIESSTNEDEDKTGWWS